VSDHPIELVVWWHAPYKIIVRIKSCILTLKFYRRWYLIKNTFLGVGTTIGLGCFQLVKNVQAKWCIT
jgi:hypothetical protein